MGVNSLPKTVTRQRRDCDLNPGPSAPESETDKLARSSLLLLLLHRLAGQGVARLSSALSIADIGLSSRLRYELGPFCA